MKTREDHIKRHLLLHEYLDELVADWITQTLGLPSEASIMDLMEWAHEQTINPSDRNGMIG